jgi:cyanate permease
VRSRSPLILLTLLWLIGIALRLAILAVPPVIPTLRDEFNLSGTEIGILSGVPRESLLSYSAWRLSSALAWSRGLASWRRSSWVCS